MDQQVIIIWMNVFFNFHTFMSLIMLLWQYMCSCYSNCYYGDIHVKNGSIKTNEDILFCLFMFPRYFLFSCSYFQNIAGYLILNSTSFIGYSSDTTQLVDKVTISFVFKAGDTKIKDIQKKIKSVRTDKKLAKRQRRPSNYHSICLLIHYLDIDRVAHQ